MKIIRQQNKKRAATKTGKQRLRGNKRLGLRDGVPSLLCIGMMFLAGGILAIVFPIPFASPGIPGKPGIPVGGSFYSSNQTAGWGVIFVLLSVFFLVAAHRHQRS